MSVETTMALVRFAALLTQIGFGVWLFSSRLPLRRHGRIWALLILAAYVALLSLLARDAGYQASNSLPQQLISFSLFLVACFGVVLARRETSVATALFCATAGYTTQNLASGIDGLVKLLALTWHGIPEENMLLWVPSFILCTLIVYIPVYLLFVRRVRSMALDRTEHRGMVAMLVVVLLVVILFDVCNKSLPGFGVPLFVTCGLRTIHGVVCCFVLYAEYQMVFNRRLQIDMATTEKALEERGRQYELSRETIAAVNRRAHDIRHQVARQLNDAQVDRETLAQVVRTVDVYDAGLRTGNEAVDTALTEKGLVCRREGITLTCIADGTALASLPAGDAYTLVSALLDEAIAAAQGADDPERQTISLSIRLVGQMATVHVECFCVDPIDDGDIAEQITVRHGGWFSRTLEDGVLSLDVALPL